MNTLSPSENTLLGVVSGTEVLLVVQPMIFWKNSAQQGLPFTADPTKIYRGLGASASSQALITGFQFFTTGVIKHALVGDGDRRLTEAETVGAALLGGSLSGLICGPTELLMIQQQRHGGSLLSTAGRLLNTVGVTAFARGIIPSVVREGAYCCGYLGIAPAMSRLFEETYTGNETTGEGSGGAGARIAGALVGGVFAGLMSHPFDTFKTCLQGDVEKKEFRNMRSVVSSVGFAGMFRGVAWRSTIIVSATLLINIFKDFSAPLMFPARF